MRTALILSIICLTINSTSVFADEERVADSSEAVVTVLPSPDFYTSFFKVDDKSTSNGLFDFMLKREVRVPPGEHTFTVATKFGQGRDKKLSFTVEAGRRYLLASQPRYPEHIVVEKIDEPGREVDRLIHDTDGKISDLAQFVSSSVISKRHQYEEYRYRYDKTTSTADMKDFIRLYTNNDPDNLVDSVQQRLLEAERIAEQANRKNQEITQASNKLMRKKQDHRSIGEQVCHYANEVTHQELAGGFFGQSQFYQSVNGKSKISAFVEGVSKGKLKLRISGLTFTKDGGYNAISMEQFDNFHGSSLKLNSIIWDNTYNWVDCL